MKYLNKVVFINSASIRYAELKLNGHVHLAGKSGAGKSTVLRGILYFFTADQIHMGIDSNKQGFNMYYFPEDGSHIAYEFKKDEDSFTIILTKDKYNNIQFAFVDAPYNKDWIIDPVTGAVAITWSEITKNIPQHIDRELITKIKDYLSILWGCHPDKRYSRYSISFCKAYNEILKAQKDVFLNSRLSEGGFRGAIVKTLNCESPKVNLLQLRNRLENFEKEVADMTLWKKIEQKEDCDVTALANNVMENYYKYVEAEQRINNILGQLQYALHKAKENLPGMNERRKELSQIINNLSESLSAIDDKIKEKERKSSGEVLLKQRELQEIEALEKKYINIEAIRREVESLNVRKIELETLKEEYVTCKDQNLDIENKFEKLKVNLQKNHQNIIDSINSAINKRQAEDNIKIKNFEETRDEAKKQIESSYEGKTIVIEKEIKKLQDDKVKLVETRATLFATKLYSNEIETAKKQKDELEKNFLSLENKINNKKAEDIRIQEEANKKEKEIREDLEKVKAEADKKKKKLTEELQEIEAILSRYDMTLYAWLDKNKDGWKSSIGKIVDESVLYRTDLHPHLSEEKQDKTLYGIMLDVDKIEDRPYTPEDYKNRGKQIESEINNIDLSLRQRAIDCEALIEQDKNNYKKRLREIREEVAKLELQKNCDSARIKKLGEDVRLLQEKAEKEKRESLKKVNEKLNGVNDSIKEKEEVRNCVLKEKKSELKTIDDKYKENVLIIKNYFDAFKKEREEEKENEGRKYESQKNNLDNQKSEELLNKKVDVSKIKNLENKIEEGKKKIKELEEKDLFVQYYNKDYAEKIVHKQEWQLELQNLQSKAERIRLEGIEEKNKKKEELAQAKEEDKKLEDETKIITRGLDEYEREKNMSINFEPGTNIKQVETDLPVIDLISEYKILYKNKEDYMLGLRKNIKNFKVKFKTNVFELPTEFMEDEDFVKYAKALIEVISFNVIGAFCRGKRENYVKTLLGVKMSVDGLEIEMAKIKGIINEIDNEFQKCKLPDVITEIRIRHADMVDELYNCLLEIKDFIRLNEGILSGVDIFTTQGEYSKAKDDMMNLLSSFVKILFKAGNVERNEFTIEDMFQVEFNVTENGNKSGWIKGLQGKIGSEGTDIMIKMLLNIIIISRSIKKNLKDKDFFFHCILDESEKIHAEYMRDVIDFCSERGISLVLGSAMTVDPLSFKNNYLLFKNNKHQTQVQLLVAEEDL